MKGSGVRIPASALRIRLDHRETRADTGRAESRWQPGGNIHAAEILGIPYDRVQQVALITVGYTLGTDFKPGRRVALERVVRYERWR